MLISRINLRVLFFVILGFWTTMKSKITGGCKRCTFQIGLIQQKYFPFPISWSRWWQKVFLNKNSAISGSRSWLWLCQDKLSLTLWSEWASSSWLKFKQTVDTTLIICLFICFMFHFEAAAFLMAEFQQSISKFSLTYFHFILYFAHNLIPWSSRLPLVGSSSSKPFAQLLFPPSLSPSPFPQRFENYIRLEGKKENIFHRTKKKVKILFVSADLGVGDLFWKSIFSLNQAWKWFDSKFNSKQNPKYSFKKIFIQ